MVKLTSRYRFVIPRSIREKLGIKPGMPVYFDMVNKNEARISTMPLPERDAETTPKT